MLALKKYLFRNPQTKRLSLGQPFFVAEIGKCLPFHNRQTVLLDIYPVYALYLLKMKTIFIFIQEANDDGI